MKLAVFTVAKLSKDLSQTVAGCKECSIKFSTFTAQDFSYRTDGNSSRSNCENEVDMKRQQSIFQDSKHLCKI